MNADKDSSNTVMKRSIGLRSRSRIRWVLAAWSRTSERLGPSILIRAHPRNSQPHKPTTSTFPTPRPTLLAIRFKKVTMQAPAVTTRRNSLALMASSLMATLTHPTFAAPPDTMTIAVHISLAPAWFDPGETGGYVTAYMLTYGLHDALIKAMPEGLKTPGLATSHTVTEDGLTHEFVLREGPTFHNGDPVTVDDVKFSFERYHGNAAKMLRDGVASVETPDAKRIVFHLKEPWPDFMTFFAAASGAGWVVPRKYIEKVGDAGFLKAPIGAGPFKFASFVPGQELVLEANETYWRHSPKIKRIVMKVIPDEATRLIALRRGEVDFSTSS